MGSHCSIVYLTSAWFGSNQILLSSLQNLNSPSSPGSDPTTSSLSSLYSPSLSFLLLFSFGFLRSLQFYLFVMLCCACLLWWMSDHSVSRRSTLKATMAQIVLHGTLHVTVFEAKSLEHHSGGGGRRGLFHKVILWVFVVVGWSSLTLIVCGLSSCPDSILKWFSDLI